ncbi:MAG: hypothetical protein A07HB70_02125 [uncultured archaeon A07HB70]|nr:MAG: hypothetical protein A07HB70_02125 [uncultured archaeon A07HB70]
MIQRETCLEGAVRAAAGLVAVGVGHLGGSFVGSLFPTIGPLVYLISVLPFGVVGLYVVATGAWVVAEGAALQAMERGAASAAVDPADRAGPSTGGDDDSS